MISFNDFLNDGFMFFCFSRHEKSSKKTLKKD